MRFLVDERTGPAVASWLHGNGYEVFSVFEEARGMNDDDIIQKSVTENWILITNDKDFGDKVFRDGRLHRGVILCGSAALLNHSASEPARLICC